MTGDDLIQFVEAAWPQVCPGQPLDRTLILRIALHLPSTVTPEDLARELAEERRRVRLQRAADTDFRPGARDPGQRVSEPPTPRWARRRRT